MKKNALRFLFLLFVLSCFVFNSNAETRGFDRQPTKEQKEKVRERIETLRMWKLTKALDLDEKTSAQLFPLLNKYDRKRAEIENAMRNDMEDMRDALRDGRRDNVKLKGILDRLEQNHKAMQAVNEEERAELKKILTVEQQAKFIIFQHEFNDEMRRIIADVRGKRQDRPGIDRLERP